jgi:acyl carrier protein
MKNKSDIIKQICQSIEEVSLGAINAQNIAIDDRLIGDLGLDSLDYATVMLSVERWGSIKIREDAVNWAVIQTVEQLAVLFEQHQEL